MSDIKKYFKSRFENGVIMEADYSQLEVYALAHIAGVKQLKEDLLAGIDLHSQNAALLAGMSYGNFVKGVDMGDKHLIELRKQAKGMSFQLQYGASPKGMSKSLGVHIDTATDFVYNYYKRYPEIKEYRNKVIDCVGKTMHLTTEHTKGGFPRKQGHYTSTTGRIYAFKTYDNEYKSKYNTEDTKISYTEISNYPIQGFATGDIVPMMLGKLYRALKNDEHLCDRALLVNSIHDSIVLDISKEVINTATYVVKSVLESAPQALKEEFGIDFDLPLKVSVKTGDTWYGAA